MKLRWCHLVYNQPSDCGVGWGSADSSGFKTCLDGEAEDNCHRLIEIPDDRLFGNNIRRTMKALKSK